MKALITLLLPIALFGCSFNSNEATVSVPTEDNATVSVSYVEEEGTEDAIYADVAIEGMACAMSCGGSIKKCLGKMDGVEKTEIDFDAEKAVNTVTVKISESVDEKTLISELEKLNDGQFTVKSMQVRKITASGIEAEEETEGDKDVSFTIDLPNIFDVFTRIF